MNEGEVNLRLLALVGVLLIAVPACTSIKRTQHLRVGMTPAQTHKVLGNPVYVQNYNGNMVEKYHLFRPGWGTILTYLTFDQSNKLTNWFVSEDEWRQTQRAWLDALNQPATLRLE